MVSHIANMSIEIKQTQDTNTKSARICHLHMERKCYVLVNSENIKKTASADQEGRFILSEITKLDISLVLNVFNETI